METARLKAIREPSKVERLLDRLVTQARLVPVDAYQRRDPSELPSALQRVLRDSVNKERCWACWADGFRIWFFTAEMSLSSSRERGAPVLMVSQYSEQGSLKEAGQWTVDRDGNWQHCTD